MEKKGSTSTSSTQSRSRKTLSRDEAMRIMRTAQPLTERVIAKCRRACCGGKASV